MASLTRAAERSLVELSSFFLKELCSLLRQPQLFFSFIVGPMLILGAFGVGYRGQPDQLRGILVLPAASAASDDPQAYRDLFTYLLTIDAVTRDRAAAERDLAANRADVAVIVTGQIEPELRAGRQVQLTVLYNEVDPLQASWVPFLASLAVQDLNRRVELKLIGDLQERVGQAGAAAEAVDREANALDSALRRGDRAAAQASVERINRSLDATGPVAALALAATLAGALDSSADSRGEVAALDESLTRGDVGTADQLRRVERLRAAAQTIAAQAHELAEIPPEVIAAPFTIQATNTAAARPSVIGYYAPAVVALLLQHIALSLVSLSVVRERLLGAMEIYRVAPIGARAFIVGKSLSYGLVLAVLAGLLMLALTRLIHVPLIGSPLWAAASLGLLLFASLGLGFLLALFARSEMQAVQLAMLILLGSIIFGDFFLSIENLWEPIRGLSYLFPVTYATDGLRAVMLRGSAPAPWMLIGPLLLGLGSYGVGALGIARELATE